jgi:hypothetical protein
MMDVIRWSEEADVDVSTAFAELTVVAMAAAERPVTAKAARNNFAAKFFIFKYISFFYL